MNKVKVQGPRGEKKILDLCETEEQLEKMTVLLLKKKISQQLSISKSLFSNQLTDSTAS
uniref:Uncharacterized protein n=1 Tax=Salarias fasciatus TaxID=181472 RepID=A0A672F1A6_SALFA